MENRIKTMKKALERIIDFEYRTNKKGLVEVEEIESIKRIAKLGLKGELL